MTFLKDSHCDFQRDVTMTILKGSSYNFQRETTVTLSGGSNLLLFFFLHILYISIKKTQIFLPRYFHYYFNIIRTLYPIATINNI